MRFWVVEEIETLPLEVEVMGTLRRSLSRRRSFRSGVDMDDRGWTMLHIGCRKGDLGQVNSWSHCIIHVVVVENVAKCLVIKIE